MAISPSFSGIFFPFQSIYSRQFNVKFGPWSFLESGHGKGDADGIGVSIKRTADLLVAQEAKLLEAKAVFNNLKDKTHI